MVNLKNTSEIITELTLLKFFPSDPRARLALVEIIAGMAENEDQVRWLVRRTLDVHNEWPGLMALRNLFCERFRPADGVDPRFPDGSPRPLSTADRQKVIGAGEQKLITDGSAPDPTTEEDLRHTLWAISRVRSISVGFDAKATPEEIASAPEWLRKLEGYE